MIEDCNRIQFEDLLVVNGEIKTTPITGKDYADVSNRIIAFRKLFPNGTITTEIVSMTTDDKGKGVCVIRATAMNEDGKILGTGHAYEKEGSSFINSTSYIENAETSAVGRALGMIGIGIDVSVASYEEVANAIKQQEDMQAKPKAKATKKAKEEVAPVPEDPEKAKKKEAYNELIAFCKENDLDLNKIVSDMGLTKDSTYEDFRTAKIYAGSFLI